MVRSRAAARMWVDKRHDGVWSQPRSWVPMTYADLQKLANDVLEEYGLIGELAEIEGEGTHG